MHINEPSDGIVDLGDFRTHVGQLVVIFTTYYFKKLNLVTIGGIFNYGLHS